MEVQMGDQPEQPQPQPQQGARKKRTATRLVDSEEPQEIDFNDLGQHCGDKQIKFGNECGVLTRSRISINYQTWKEVPQPQRDMLWLTIKRRWTNLNNNNKGDVLKICNTTWKSFKKRLKRDFLDTGRDPLPVFPYLDAKTWEKFKADRSSKEFQVRSEKASKNAKLQKNPARLGPHGYRGKKAEWEKEIASGGLLPELYKIKSQRTRDFVMGRLSKDDRGLYKAPPNMQPIMTELVEVENQICEGDWVPGPGEDSLTAVLGREHPGRTRAVGHTVGLRKAMQGFEQKKKKDQVKESMDEMRNKLEGVTGEVAELKTVIDELKKQLTNDVNPGVQNSSDGLTPILDAITEPTHCELMLPYGAMDQNCAIGMVFPYGNGLIHSLPLRENHMKVMIDKINTNLQSLPIPVPTDEVGNLQYAVGQIIQWPRNAISITKVQATKQHISTSSVLQKTARGGEAPGANQNISTSSVLQKTTTVGTKNNTRTQINKPRPIESLRERLKNNPLVYVVADYGIFQAGTFEFWVAQEEIFRLLSKKTIDVTIITAWQMILNLMARGKNKCSFINPHRITGGDCQKNPEDVVNYLVEAMRIHHAKHFLLAPYLQSEHWVLLVICPHTRTAYILDSSTGPTKKPVDTYYLVKRHVDTAFARYQKDTSDSISWILPECNQQLSNWECGYYVMKWMLDFVMVGQHGLLSKTDTPWNDETPIPEKTLVSIVATWASQFQRNYM